MKKRKPYKPYFSEAVRKQFLEAHQSEVEMLEDEDLGVDQEEVGGDEVGGEVEADVVENPDFDMAKDVAEKLRAMSPEEQAEFFSNVYGQLAVAPEGEAGGDGEGEEVGGEMGEIPSEEPPAEPVTEE